MMKSPFVNRNPLVYDFNSITPKYSTMRPNRSNMKYYIYTEYECDGEQLCEYHECLHKPLIEEIMSPKFSNDRPKIPKRTSFVQNTYTDDTVKKRYVDISPHSEPANQRYSIGLNTYSRDIGKKCSTGVGARSEDIVDRCSLGTNPSPTDMTKKLSPRSCLSPVDMTKRLNPRVHSSPTDLAKRFSPKACSSPVDLAKRRISGANTQQEEILKRRSFGPTRKSPARMASVRSCNQNVKKGIGTNVVAKCFGKDEKSVKIISMDWEKYHRLDVIHNFMDQLELEFPSLCTVGVIGKSLEGRDIKLLKISNSNATNAPVWIDAGIHAREWIGPAVNTFVANYIVRNFHTLPASVTNKDWYFLPVINPDGYEYSHTIDRMWRKNRAWHAGKCVGVDLNRNFSYGWGEKGSSDVPTHCFYRGTEAFSEPESCAVRDMISNSGVSFKVYITLHSYGEVIIFPFATKDDLCPDYIRLLQGATVMSKAIYQTNGNTYKVGVSKDVMYKASGTSNDWSYGVAGIPYCYLIELRSKKHRFKLPQEEIAETGQEIVNCMLSLMDFVDTYPLKNVKK